MSNEELRKAQLIVLDMLIDVDRICRKNNIKYALDSGTLLGAVRHKGFIPWDDDIDIIMMRDEYNKFINIFNEELGMKYKIESNVIKKNYIVTWTKIINKENFVIDTRNIEYDRGIFIDIFPYDFYSTQKLKRIYLENISKEKEAATFLEKLVKGIVYRLKYILIENKPELYKRMINYMIKITNIPSSIIGLGKEVVPFSINLNFEDLYPLKELKFEGRNFYVPNKYNKFLIELYGESYMQLPPVEERNTHSKGFLFKDSCKESEFQQEYGE